MGKFSDKAKKIDMYASLPSLSFGKDGKVYSRFGLLLTFLTIVIIGGMAIWIGIKVFGRQKPAFIQYDLPPKEWNPKISFNTDDFKFGLSIMQDEAERLVSLWPQFTDFEGLRMIPLTTRECEFDIAPGEVFTCFDQAENTKGETYLDVKGNWRFDFMYNYCWDPTKNCYSQTDADTKFVDDHIMGTIFYEDLLIDPFDYENPVSMTTGFAQQAIYLSVGTSIVVELNEVEFISDNGWLFEEKEIITKFKPTITTKLTDTKLLTMQIKYGGTKTVYKRTYPKIQDFLAQVSGFITIITPIFLILISPYGNLRAIQHMTNEIYEIKLNKPNNNSGGDSPQKPAAAKRKRRSSKSKVSPTLTKEIEGDLLPKKTIAKSKTRGQSLSTNRGNTLTSPHAALVIGGMDKLPTKELPAPKENLLTFQFDTFEQTGSASKIAPHEVSSNLISPEKAHVAPSQTRLLDEQKSPEGLEVKDLENSEVDDQTPEEEEEVSDCETDVPLRTSDLLEVPWQTWLKSFWKPNPEVQVLKKAKEHLMEAFDLVTLSKKVIEIDKLKACLFTHDQRVIFENLPSSVIVLNPEVDLKSPEAVKQYHWKETFKGDEIAVRKAYARLKGTANQLDQLLLRLYESEYIDNGFRQEE